MGMSKGSDTWTLSRETLLSEQLGRKGRGQIQSLKTTAEP
jgi:hypothetical protein